jgi:hypothetical protein
MMIAIHSSRLVVPIAAKLARRDKRAPQATPNL